MSAPMQRRQRPSTDHPASPDPAQISSRPSSGGSGGQALDKRTQTNMSARFGHDFSQVRIHTDARAGESADALGANAYALGSDIFFGEGKFTPGSLDTERLLAHELTHVVQQERFGPGDPARTSARGDASEREADTLASQVMMGHAVHVQSAPGAALARDEDGGGGLFDRISSGMGSLVGDAEGALSGVASSVGTTLGETAGSLSGSLGHAASGIGGMLGGGLTPGPSGLLPAFPDAAPSLPGLGSLGGLLPGLGGKDGRGGSDAGPLGLGGGAALNALPGMLPRGPGPGGFLDSLPRWMTHGGAGLVQGVGQSILPLGWTLPSANPKDKDYETGRGIGQMLGGLGEAFIGAEGEVVGGLFDLTGIGAAVGIPINIASTGLIANGLAGMLAGGMTILNASSMGGGSGGESDAPPVRKGGIPDEEPASLQEQVAMQEAKSGQGRQIIN